jgi:hypothetical protein
MKTVIYVRPGEDTTDSNAVYIGDKRIRDDYDNNHRPHMFANLCNSDYQSLSPLLYLRESCFVIIYESPSSTGFLAHTKGRVLDIEERLDAYMRAYPRRPSDIDTILRGLLGERLANASLPAIRMPPTCADTRPYGYVELISTTKSAPDTHKYLFHR